MLLQWWRTRDVFIISFKGPFLIFQLGIRGTSYLGSLCDPLSGQSASYPFYHCSASSQTDHPGVSWSIRRIHHQNYTFLLTIDKFENEWRIKPQWIQRSIKTLERHVEDSRKAREKMRRIHNWEWFHSRLRQAEEEATIYESNTTPRAKYQSKHHKLSFPLCCLILQMRSWTESSFDFRGKKYSKICQKINWSLKTRWHRPRIGAARFRLWAPSSV